MITVLYVTHKQPSGRDVAMHSSQLCCACHVCPVERLYSISRLESFLGQQILIYTLLSTVIK